ncbi:MAG: hypothetical protein P4L99_28160 [Chthoniobacter sp.]|nr:hypothetical protein [Chthoniobacter sp.]
MTFPQARAISKTGLHVRRDSWPADKWFMLWRGTWFCFGTEIVIPRAVLATDYGVDDLRAEDWNTVPPALGSCPITPTEPSGGSPPTPGAGGFPDDPFNPFPPAAGSGGGAPGGGGGTLPPPDPGTSVHVRFAGIVESEGLAMITDITGVEDALARTVSCTPSGSNVWTGGFTGGKRVFPADPSELPVIYSWAVTVTKFPADGTWTVSLEGVNAFGLIYASADPGPRNFALPSDNPSIDLLGGTATVI